MAGIILTAAGPGFPGLGAQPPQPERGAMMAGGRRFLIDDWWVATIPGLAIFIVSPGFNLLVMQQGRAVEDLTRARLLAREATERYTRDLLTASEGYRPDPTLQEA